MPSQQRETAEQVQDKYIKKCLFIHEHIIQSHDLITKGMKKLFFKLKPNKICFDYYLKTLDFKLIW